MSQTLPQLTKSKIVITTFGLSVASLIYKLVDVAGNVEFILQKIGVDDRVAKFLSSPRGIDFMVVASLLALVLAVAYQVKRHQVPEQGQTETKVDEVVQCPDKWLHEIAEEQRQAIDNWVRVVDCRIEGHELLRDEPYVNFIFYVHNDSIYSVSIDDSLGGSISIGSRQLHGQLKWRENPIKDMPLGTRNVFIIQQRLNKEDVVTILNHRNYRFDFARLEVMGKGSLDFKDRVVPKRLNIYPQTLASDELLKNYPKLEIAITHATFYGFGYSLGTSPRHLLVSIQVIIKNLRPARIEIRSFRLSGKIDDPLFGKDYVVYAEVGEIYKGRLFDEQGRVAISGQLLKNLNPPRESFISLEPKQPESGWLQFIIRGVGFEEPSEMPAMLFAIEATGEEHPVECKLVYKAD